MMIIFMRMNIFLLCVLSCIRIVSRWLGVEILRLTVWRMVDRRWIKRCRHRCLIKAIVISFGANWIIIRIVMLMVCIEIEERLLCRLMIHWWRLWLLLLLKFPKTSLLRILKNQKFQCTWREMKKVLSNSPKNHDGLHWIPYNLKRLYYHFDQTCYCNSQYGSLQGVVPVSCHYFHPMFHSFLGSCLHFAVDFDNIALCCHPVALAKAFEGLVVIDK